MIRDRITAMVAAGESETLEFKKTTGLRREATKTVCAMLNLRGGHVLFGVTSKGQVDGQQVSERTIEEVSEELARIDPPTFPTVERVPFAGASMSRFKGFQGIFRGLSGSFPHFSTFFPQAGVMTVP